MNDDELDLILRKSAPQLTMAAATLSRSVAGQALPPTAIRAAQRRRRFRTRVLVPVAVGAALLTGAGTLKAYQMSIPPYVGLEPGVERVTEPIRLTYTTDAGTVLDCQVYLEFTNVRPEQRAGLNALAELPLWTGFGQSVYDSLPADSRAQQDGPEETWMDRVSHRIYVEASAAVPHLMLNASGAVPSVHGLTTRCDYPQGQR